MNGPNCHSEGYAALGKQLTDIAEENRALRDEVADLRRELAEARDRALEEAAKRLGPPNAATLRLHLGEMTGEEVRTVQAALIWKQAEISQIRTNP